MAKVAVASTDGISINEHFGKAQKFLIYEVGPDETYQLLETRKNDSYCSSEQKDHSVDKTAALLADVQAVLVSQIGPGAIKELHERGIAAVALTGSVDKALKAYAKRGRLLQSFADRGSCECSQGCSGKSRT